MTNPCLSVKQISAGYSKEPILDGFDLDIPEGKITVIVGANACGKSTLLKTMSRLLKPQKGHVILDGKSIHRIPSKELARQLGLLPQSPVTPEGISVFDLVSRGRHPHLGHFGTWTAQDSEAVAEALNATKTTDIADRPVEELSGGQRQRVWIAMALAQRTEILLLDEPTTFLDISHQVEVLDLLTDLNVAKDKTIVMILHDLNLAARYADFLVTMVSGKLFRAGSPEEILTRETVQQVFNIDSHIMTDPISGRPTMMPIGRHRVINS